jgi:tryptophan-rich hypothetical protein
MNKFNADKLLLSKWTATAPINKKKHFLVVELMRDEFNQQIVSCVLEAVIDKEQFNTDWQDLKNSELWIQGWK